MKDWLRVRKEVDPEGVFVGDWHRRHLLPEAASKGMLPLEERVAKSEHAKAGGLNWFGQLATKSSSPHSSEESFDMMHEVKAEAKETDEAEE